MMSDSLDHGRDSKLSHVKKPLNAFMLYMKDMRPKVVAECTLKESAAINQILGKKVSCAYSIGIRWTEKENAFFFHIIGT